MCKRLWTEPEVAHHGEFFDFDGAVFEPKPVQQPWPPILVGGESDAALRRAACRPATAGSAWPTPSSRRGADRRLRELLDAEDRRDADRPFQICVGGPVRLARRRRAWEEIGVTRLVISPWSRSPEAVDGMRRYAELVGHSR